VIELEREDWLRQKAAYARAVAPLAADRLHRAGRGIKHPVYDFLFEYYSHPPAKLLAWSPGANVLLRDATPADTGWPQLFEPVDSGAVLNSAKLGEKQRLRLHADRQYLEATSKRPAFLGCFGLHEWAMVYRAAADRRHTQYPLRVTEAELEAAIESLGLRCTHFDAFRFFTADATPKNRIELTRQNAIEHEQPGCVHAAMDLYQFAYRYSPFVSGELLAACFELAALARELDMRASPYDLRALGYEAVAVETKAGREMYVVEQLKIAERATELRGKLIVEYAMLA
jgi:hypothetical protein